MQQEIISMKKYILWFSITYIVCSAVVGGLLIYFDIDANSSSFVVVLMSAYVSVHYYIKDHGRALSKSEIWSATWGAWGASMLITLLYIMCIFIYNFYDFYGQVSLADIKTEILKSISLSMNVLFGIMTFVIILALGTTRLAYGISNQIQSKQIIARAKD